MLRFASVLCFISVARAQKVPLSDNVDKRSSALCSDRNHRMTHHRGSFRWFNMPRWNPRCCLDCTWTHYLLCQTHAYLCGERAHTHLTPALVYDLLCVCVWEGKSQLQEIVAGATQSLSFRMYWSCADVLWAVTFESGLRVTQARRCWLLHFDRSGTPGGGVEATGDLRWRQTWGHIGPLITRRIPGLTR